MNKTKKHLNIKKKKQAGKKKQTRKKQTGGVFGEDHFIGKAMDLVGKAAWEQFKNRGGARFAERCEEKMSKFFQDYERKVEEKINESNMTLAQKKVVRAVAINNIKTMANIVSFMWAAPPGKKDEELYDRIYKIEEQLNIYEGTLMADFRKSGRDRVHPRVMSPSEASENAEERNYQNEIRAMVEERRNESKKRRKEREETERSIFNKLEETQRSMYSGLEDALSSATESLGSMMTTPQPNKVPRTNTHKLTPVPYIPPRSQEERPASWKAREEVVAEETRKEEENRQKKEQQEKKNKKSRWWNKKKGGTTKSNPKRKTKKLLRQRPLKLKL